MRPADYKIGYLGVGSYLPELVLNNAHLERMVDTSDEWILQRTGIRTRRIMGPGESPLSMAVAACRRALDHAGIEASRLSALRVGVNTHLRFPSLAAMIAEELGLPDVSAADVSAGCSGFIFAVEELYNRILADFTVTGQETYGIAVGVDALSLVTDWTDRATCVLFGDGAGAAVVGPVQDGEILSIHTRVQGKYAGLLYLDDMLSPAVDDPATMRFRPRNGVAYPYLHMEGRKVFQVAVKSMMADIQEALARYNRSGKGTLSLEDIQFVIPHQANLRIVAAVQEGLKLKPEQVYSEGVVNYGNTSAASIPIGYVDTWGRHPGAVVVDVAFGAGFASGAILRREPVDPKPPQNAG